MLEFNRAKTEMQALFTANAAAKRTADQRNHQHNEGLKLTPSGCQNETTGIINYDMSLSDTQIEEQQDQIAQRLRALHVDQRNPQPPLEEQIKNITSTRQTGPAGSQYHNKAAKSPLLGR